MRNILSNNLGTMSAYDLIMQLDKTTPARCMSQDETVANHQRYAGKRDLIESLLARLKSEER